MQLKKLGADSKCNDLNEGKGCGDYMHCVQTTHKYQAEMIDGKVRAHFFSCGKSSNWDDQFKNSTVDSRTQRDYEINNGGL